MNDNTNAPTEVGASPGGLETTATRVRRARPMLVATRGRIEFAVRCPGCKHLHRHINLGIVDAPCGAVYNLGPRRGRVQ